MDPRLVTLLACPADGHFPLTLHQLDNRSDVVEEGVLVCPRCSRLYFISDGIPRMLTEQWKSLLDRSLFDQFADFCSSRPELLQSYQALRDQMAVQTGEVRWAVEEMRFWEEKEYAGRAVSSNVSPARDSSTRVAGDRILPRDQHLISFVRRDVPGKWVADLGCGEATTAHVLLDPAQYRYNYVGTDLSINALRIARRRIAGSFVQAATQELPFRPDGFDVVLLLGVLHHMPLHEEHVSALVRDQLKPGGYLLIHEGWTRSRLLPNSLTRRLAPEESEHEDRVDRERLLALIAEQCAVLHVHDEYSPIRTGLVLVLGSVIERSPTTTKAVLLVDRLVIQTLGRVIPSMAAGAGLVVARKHS